MKTDRFTDSIRRKLESIRPEFTEKDWARMQTTLHQATPPQPGSAPSGHSLTGSSWFSQPFMMAAAAVSTVLLVTFSVWQRHEINQLRHTVTQLSQQPKRLPETPGSVLNAPAPNVAQVETRRQADEGKGRAGSDPTGRQAMENQSGQSSPANQPVRSEERRNRPDTVYVTRYVAVPTRQSTPVNERVARHTEMSVGSERYAAANPATVPVNKSPKTVLPATDQSTSSTDAPDVAVTDGVNTRPAPQSRPAPRESTDRRDIIGMSEATNRRDVAFKPTRRSKNQLAKEVGRNRELVTQEVSNPPSNTDSRSVETGSPLSDNRKATQSKELGNTSAGPEPSGSQSTEMAPTEYALATSRPLTLSPKDWQKSFVRRARSMHSTQALFTEVQQPLQPLSQPVNPLVVKVRAGVGGEVSAGLWSTGVFSELLLGKNWTLGLGILSKSQYSAGTFRNDYEFDDQTHHDFRQYYTRGIGPKIDIQNIDTRTVRMQIPISIGYRVPINRTLTFLPTVSTYLTLRNTETVTFYYRDQPFGPSFKAANFQMDRPVDPFTSFTIGTSLEYHKGHWAAQAGPMLTMPLQETMNWQNTVSAGLRVRAFYQF